MKTATFPPRLRVTEPAEAQWARVRAVRLASLAADPDAFGSALSDEVDQPATFWIERHRRALRTLLATLDGTDVGLAVVADAWADPVDAAVFGVWVAPSARGAGVGDALMAAAVDAARAAGRRRLVLEVAVTNAPAIGLYARLGFRDTGARRALPDPRAHIIEQEMALVL